MHLSVVVTIVDAGETLKRCLVRARGPGRSAGDGDHRSVGRQRRRHGGDRGDVSRPSASSRWALCPRRVRRRARLASTSCSTAVGRWGWRRRRGTSLRFSRTAVCRGPTGPEDGGVHERLPHAVIGGAIENGLDGLCTGRCSSATSIATASLRTGPRRYVSDVNIGYKRRAIERDADLWRERYHETTVHWALQRAGETLYLTPEPVVRQFRTTLSLGSLVRERFAWGRLFAYTRARAAACP